MLQISRIKQFVAAVILFTSAGFVQANVIYDFKCDEPTCGGNDGWGGFFEISDEAVANGSLIGITEIRDFIFTSNDQGGLTFLLNGLSRNNGIAMTFSGDGSLITSITDNGSAGCLTTPDVCFRSTERVGPIFDAISVSATSVNDFNFTEQSGVWVRRTFDIPEPGTLFLFVLGFAGLVYGKRMIPQDQFIS